MMLMRLSINTRRLAALFLFALAILSSRIALADLPAAPGFGVPTLEQSSEVAANDELSVAIINFPNLNTTTVVPSDGEVTLPLIGDVKVLGKTTNQLSHELTPMFSKYLKEPILSVSLTVKHSAIVTVGGSVVRPGTVTYSPGIHLVDAVIQAGGPLQSADLSQVTVVHRDGDQQTTDITDPAKAAGTPADLLLQEGDAVYIPLSTREISIVGQVKAPGSYPYHDNMTVLDAIGLGGGVTDVADLKNAHIANGASDTPVDLQKLLQQGDTSANVVLHPGDTIAIPLVSRTYIFGDVNRPGYYPFQPGDRIIDALNGAGGTTQNADTSKIFLIRAAADKSAAVSTPVDLNKFFKNGDITANVPLNPGDVVFVSDKNKKTPDYGGWSSLLYGLGFLTRL